MVLIFIGLSSAGRKPDHRGIAAFVYGQELTAEFVGDRAAVTRSFLDQFGYRAAFQRNLQDSVPAVVSADNPARMLADDYTVSCDSDFVLHYDSFGYRWLPGMVGLAGLFRGSLVSDPVCIACFSWLNISAPGALFSIYFGS
jgi:hypothetical protein